ncbi:7136_t:CDS:2, partial [Cetraspora pellucida]
VNYWNHSTNNMVIFSMYGRNIVLCDPRYIVKIHKSSTKSKYMRRNLNTEGREYGLIDNGVFNNNNIHELVEEMESCWHRIGIIIGEKDLNDVNETSIKNNELNLSNWMLNNQEMNQNSLITCIQTYIEGIIYFRLCPKFFRYYFPYTRRIVQIEETSSNEELRNDMLTFIITNTDRDTNKGKFSE